MNALQPYNCEVRNDTFVNTSCALTWLDELLTNLHNHLTKVSLKTIVWALVVNIYFSMYCAVYMYVLQQ